jgi:hypothetical protein
MSNVQTAGTCRSSRPASEGRNRRGSQEYRRALFDRIWELDRHDIMSGRLQRETFFGI